MFLLSLGSIDGVATADDSLLVYAMTSTFVQASPDIGIFKPTYSTSKIELKKISELIQYILLPSCCSDPLSFNFAAFRLSPTDFFPLGDTMSKDQNAMMVRDSGNGLVALPTSFT